MAGAQTPPISGRFKKGQSGNPNGRPRKVRDTQASAFDIAVNKTLTVVQNGVPRKLTAVEALQHRTYLDAIAGSRLAEREVLKMIAKREKARVAKFVGPRVRFIFRDAPKDPMNADAALLILGIATRNEQVSQKHDRGSLLLEPWAVQAALVRRRGGERLDQKEIDEIRRCTRDSAKLRWPRKSER